MRFLYVGKHFWIVSYRDILCDIVSLPLPFTNVITAHLQIQTLVFAMQPNNAATRLPSLDTCPSISCVGL